MIRIRLNGQEQETTATTLHALLDAQGVAARRGVAAARNRALVRRADWEHTRLEAGDDIEIIEALSGG